MAKRCPTCESIYGDSVDRCPEDNSELEDFDADDDELVGTIIDERFRLEGLLGAGGMGRVYRGTQLSVERDVAVKLLRGEAVPDRSMQERFFREARVISGFSHPNIIRLIDFGRDTELDLPYLVMEMAGGVSLADLTRTGRLHPAMAVEVARQVCSGLMEAHGSNIVHRDLKPDNLHLITNSDGSFLVKILDFGIAFPQDSAKNLTATGMMCGTASYVSPEQARSEDLDGQADLYSLGIILFEMLTGVRPFRGDSGFDVIMQQVQESPPSIDQFLPPGTLPKPLVHLVYDLLEKDPRQRPSGAGDVRNRLEQIAERFAEAAEVDPDKSGTAAFERWLLPKMPDQAPIHDSDTLGAGGDDDALEVAPTQAGTPDDGAAVPDVQPGGTKIADGSGASTEPQRPGNPGGRAARPGAQSTLDSESSTDSTARRSLVVAAAVAGLALAGSLAYAGYRNWAGAPEAEKPARATAPDTSSNAAELEPIDGPLNAFAGRCVVVGTSEADFHTVYFFPEVGELVLRGDGHLEWSKLELSGRRNGRIHFGRNAGADAGDARVDVRGHVRKSGDKRIFEFTDASKFVCHRESYSAYYTDLDFEGTWRSAEGNRRLTFPAAGQRFTISTGDGGDAGTDGETFQYRLLDGVPGDSELLLAVRSPGDETWSPWAMRRIRDGDALEIVRAAETDDESSRIWERPGEERASASEESTDRSGGGREPTGSEADRGAAESAGGGAGSEADEAKRQQVKEAWDHRFQQILDKCRSAYQTIQDNNAKYQRLREEGKTEQANAFAEKMGRLNKRAGQRMRQAGKEFQTLMSEISTHDVSTSKIREMSRKFSQACQGKGR